MIKRCPWCGKEIAVTSTARKYCTTACQRASANKRLRESNSTNFAKCKICGKDVKVRNMINNVCAKCRNKDKGTRKDSTICWDCKGELEECKWITRHKLIDGWSAKRNDIDGAESYIVMKCPNFLEKRLKNDARKCNDM